mmetsp:Transcript_63385/g.105441  ORF Transcript_63385/g.105441 Transcript_63385/m.105441 type:complete len:414 (-) Transcript_63385:383-1624(-)|eukprot:CAMPEP_0119315336 /NCGR_PEP_ID=MMETSP1333-20130426/35378_1 /TAXON_ID=418940 /ORGANISM="Scyphosphaera apsteinii, Strain RCC1455" /LENGTH=413 /DNA_ID=CAMNT_0007320657 /DNA_START=87 /DNA_END=1328 /DNA_ORIENTATION=+
MSDVIYWATTVVGLAASFFQGFVVDKPEAFKTLGDMKLQYPNWYTSYGEYAKDSNFRPYPQHYYKLGNFFPPVQRTIGHFIKEYTGLGALAIAVDTFFTVFPNSYYKETQSTFLIDVNTGVVNELPFWLFFLANTPGYRADPPFDRITGTDTDTDDIQVKYVDEERVAWVRSSVSRFNNNGDIYSTGEKTSYMWTKIDGQWRFHAMIYPEWPEWFWEGCYTVASLITTKPSSWPSKADPFLPNPPLSLEEMFEEWIKSFDERVKAYENMMSAPPEHWKKLAHYFPPEKVMLNASVAAAVYAINPTTGKTSMIPASTFIIKKSAEYVNKSFSKTELDDKLVVKQVNDEWAFGRSSESRVNANGKFYKIEEKTSYLFQKIDKHWRFRAIVEDGHPDWFWNGGHWIAQELINTFDL